MVQLAETPTPAFAGGDTGPPPFTAGAIFTQLRLTSLVALFLLVAAALYLYGVLPAAACAATTGRPGARWPSWLGGLGSIAAVTVTGIEAYDTTLLSRAHGPAHGAVHGGADLPGAGRAGDPGPAHAAAAAPKRAARASLHSRVVRVLTFPLVAFGLFVANPFVLYFTGLYRPPCEHAWLHELVHVHFILTGCLFFWPLLGLDPLPNRWPYPGRALLMVLSVPFHTVLGLTIMQSKTLLGGDWYPNLDLAWTDPWHDQVVGRRHPVGRRRDRQRHHARHPGGAVDPAVRAGGPPDRPRAGPGRGRGGTRRGRARVPTTAGRRRPRRYDQRVLA